MTNVALTARDVSTHIELLDHTVEDALRLRALREVARANFYFGGNRVVLRELSAALAGLSSDRVTVLDVGTGSGHLAELIRRPHAGRVTLLGVDLRWALARAARDSGTPAACGDGLSLPFRARSVDVVVCSQLLHHFADPDAVRLLSELDRVARHRVVVCDLRRSRIAAGGFWLASHPLGFHPVTRHDGVASVRRGFTAAELTRLVNAAIHREPAVRRSLGFRLAVSWRPEDP